MQSNLFEASPQNRREYSIRLSFDIAMATLWNVADASTAELMADFYTELAKPNVNKAEALQNAQLSLLRSEEYSHPYYWAPYILMGNWK